MRAWISHSWSCHRKLLAAWLLFCVSSVMFPAAVRLKADERSAESTRNRTPPRKIRFRRIYAPLNRIEDWPRDGARYIPMKSDEFERRIKSLTDRQDALQRAEPARIESAEYEAHLDPQGLLRGETKWRVVGGREGEQLLPLGSCSLAIESAKWLADEPEAATFGVDSEGRIVLAVNGTRDLVADWSIRGTDGVSGGLTFQFQLPHSARNRLRLNLPTSLVPVCDCGLVRRGAKIENDSRPWQINVGGRSNFTISLQPARPTVEAPELVFLRQSVVYDFSLQGVKVFSELTLDVHRKELRRLPLELGPGLRPIVAKLGETEIPWRIVSENGSDRTRIELTFPEPIRGAERLIQLEAAASLVRDATWTLPQVRPLEVVWLQGDTVLQIRDPLRADRLGLSKCRQSGSEPLAGGEAIRIQNYSREAAIEVFLGEQRRRPKIRYATQVEVDVAPFEDARPAAARQRITASIHADVSLADGERFVLVGDVRSPWKIESVTSEPPGATFETSSKAPHQLTVRLAESLAPKRPLRLHLRARWKAGENATMDAAGFRIVEFRGLETDRRLVRIVSREPYELETDHDEDLHRVDTAQLRPEERDLLGGDPHGILFLDDVAADRVLFRFRRSTPRYEAESDVDVTVGLGTITESYRVRCSPALLGVDKVVVEISPPLKAEIEWFRERDPTASLPARKLSDLERRTTGASSGEAWEIALGQPVAQRFVLRAKHSWAAGKNHTVRLLTVPDAAEQTGTVAIRAEPGVSIQVNDTGLKPIPPPMPAPAAVQGFRAAFRYDPTRANAPVDGQSLDISVVDTAGQLPGAVVWRSWTSSRVEVTGRIRHVAMFWIENSGRRIAAISAGEAHVIREISVDGNPQSLGNNPARKTWNIVLPADRRFTTLRVDFETEEGGLGWFKRCTLPQIEIDLPTLSRQRTVSIPPGYLASGTGSLQPQNVAGTPRWTDRFFGPLARPTPVRGNHESSAVAKPFPGIDFPRDPWPWRSDLVEYATLSGGSGWITLHGDAGNFASSEIVVASAAAIDAGFWMILCIVAASFLWIAPRRARTWMLVLAGFAGITLLLPENIAVFGTGGLLGTLAAGLTLTLLGRVPDAANNANMRSDSKISMSSTARTRPTWILVFCLASGFALYSWSAVRSDEAPAKRTLTPSVYRLFIPVDAQRKLVGDTYFVPQGLFNELHRDRERIDSGPRGYLLSRANYRVRLEGDRDGGTLGAMELNAAFDLTTYGSKIEVRLPFDQRTAKVIGLGVTLDGQSTTTTWSADGKSLRFEVATPGDYRLEIALKPATQSKDGTTSLEFQIPRIPTSRLEVEVPADAPPIRVATAQGRIEFDPSRGMMEAHLGATDRLSLKWARREEAIPKPLFDVDELVWLKVRPSAVVVETKLKFQSKDPPPRKFTMRLDPRLRWIPASSETSGVLRVQVVSGDPNRIEVMLAPEAGPAATFGLSFLWSGVSGVGNIRFPQFAIEGSRAEKRWLAISIDPALTFELQGNKTPTAVEVADVARMFDLGRMDAESAYQLPRGETDWSLATSPRSPMTSVESDLDLVYSGSHVSIRYEADLVTKSGYAFRHQFRVPAGFNATKVSIRQEDAERVTRFAQSGDGALSIILNGAMTGRQHLVVEGRLPSPKARMPLPKLELVDGQWRRGSLSIRRWPGVQVSLINVKGLRRFDEGRQNPARDDTAADDDPLLRLVGHYDVVKQDADATVLFERREPRMRATQVTALLRGDGKWWAQVDAVFDVESGFADSLRFQIPASFAGPFQFEPRLPHQVADLPGSQTSQIVVRLPQPAGGRYRLRFASPLTFAPEQRIHLPNVTPLGVTRVRRYVVLPQRVEKQQVDWETRGLVPRHLPDVFERPRGGVPIATYEAASAHGALLKPVAGVPRFDTADLRIAQTDRQSFVGLAVFDLLPAGISTCWVEMPAGARLVHGRVGGLPVAVRSADGRRFRLPLGSDQLPQRIELLFIQSSGEPPTVPALAEIEMPVLLAGETPKPLSAARSFWTFVGPNRAQTIKLDDPKHGITGMQAGVERLGRASRLLADAPGESGRIRARWYRPWAEWMTEVERRLRRFPARIPAGENSDIPSGNIDHKALTVILNEVRQQRFEFRESLPDDEWSEDPGELVGSGAGLEDLFNSITMMSRRPVERVVRSGCPAVIPVVVTVPANWDFRLRVAGFLGVIVLASLGIAVDRRGVLSDVVARWPHAIAVLVGIFWTLWLTPAVLGPLIVAAGIFSSLRLAWRGAARRPINENG